MGRPSSGSVRAKTRNVPAWPPFVIHCFAPSIRQPSPSLTAAVRSAPASEPEPDSVSANAPSTAPEASGGHEALLLRVRAEGEDRQRRGARVDGDGHADAGVRARELLEHEHVGEEVRARAAVLLGHAHAHQPELAELRDHLGREAVLAVPGGRVGNDLRLGERAGDLLDLALLGAEREVHAAPSIDRPARLPGCGDAWQG